MFITTNIHYSNKHTQISQKKLIDALLFNAFEVVETFSRRHHYGNLKDTVRTYFIEDSKIGHEYSQNIQEMRTLFKDFYDRYQSLDFNANTTKKYNYAKQVDLIKAYKCKHRTEPTNSIIENELKQIGYDFLDCYYTFWIPKSKGGYRQIDAPSDELKEALRELQHIFEHVMKGNTSHASAFAYVRGKRNYDAVKKHQKNGSRWFLKIDFKSFFNNTTFEFVYNQLKQVFPFGLIIRDEEKMPETQQYLKKCLKMCFLDGRLPQGTPISPLLTNIMMIPIDHILSNHFTYDADKITTFDGSDKERKHKLVYTRYADDIVVSARQGFRYSEVLKYINELLDFYHAPFYINSSKTKYGSNAGQNFILGCMLNQDNRITVGHKDKAQMKAMLANLVMDYKNNKLNDNWTQHDVQIVMGKYQYMKSIEKGGAENIANKINQKFDVDCIKLMKLIIADKLPDINNKSEGSEIENA